MYSIPYVPQALMVSTGLIVGIVILVVLIAAAVGLYFLGKRLEKRQDEQRAQMEQYKQQTSMLIIDKKRMKLTESGLPDAVISQTPWYAKRAKVPVVKAKIGPKIMTFIAEDEIFDEIPVKKEVKATISGLYILSVRGLHGKIEKPTVKKKGFRAWLLRKQKELQDRQ